MIKPELKIIADHLRSSAFLIADGVLPSNEGRGYVLRRIMRRAMRQLHKLGVKEVSMYKLFDVLNEEMGVAYPELGRARAVIIETLKNEEEKFRETLEKGLKILEEEIAEKKLGEALWASSKDIATVQKENVAARTFSGKTAFKLYDTFGFPLDLTQDILKEKGLMVDLKEFDLEMDEQKKRAKANWKGSGEVAEDKIFFDLKEKFGVTKFLGYETLESAAKVLMIGKNFIILNQTPFYATSGGQKGDDGLIGNIQIFETRKFADGLFVHFFDAEKQKIDFKENDEVKAAVNKNSREARAKNHSATHLMHKALKEVLGNAISQKGSNVDANYFTFDFNFNRAMSLEEIQKVEDLVNEKITKGDDVATKLMDLEEAKNSGAEALFGEKYDSQVRVVKMANSVELCGGTHVKNIKDIELFKIISEKSVASGIRRIEAKTSNSAKEFLAQKKQEEENFIVELQKKFAAKNLEIVELGGKELSLQSREIADLEDAIKKQEKEINRLKKEKLLGNLDTIKTENIGDVQIIAHHFVDLDGKDLRDIANHLITKCHIAALFASKEGKVSLCVIVAQNSLDKFDASKLISPLVEIVGGRGGGGKKDFAMGGGVDISSIDKAIELFKNLVK